jgi:cell division protein FtsW
MISEQKAIRFFLYIIATLIVVGMIMVLSSSYIFAREKYGTPFYFILKQIVFLASGLSAAFILSKVQARFWWKYGRYIHYFIILLIVMTFIPGVGVTIKGAHRWINLGFIRFQPTELFKYSLILISVPYFDNFFKYQLKERIIDGLSIFIPLVLIVKQPDFGSFTISFLVIVFIAFMSQFPRKLFYSFASVGLLSAVAVLFAQPYRVQRILTFLDPWSKPHSTGFQIIQSFLAFAHGSLFGLGLGNSNEKLFYLPEAHNDFIFSVIGEELGFIGVFTVISLFLAFIYLGFLLSIKAKKREASLIQSAIVFIIGIQASLNMAVVLGLLPTKGLNLPFISYGGSSLIANLIGIGIFLSLYNFKGNTETSSGVRSEEVRSSRTIYFTS